MNDHELKRECRRQRALERLGTNTPRCALCGYDDPLALELHHIAGRAYGDISFWAWLICLSCWSNTSASSRPSSLQSTARGKTEAGRTAVTDDRLPESSPSLPEPDRLPVAVRAYVPPPPPKPSAESSRKTRSGKPTPPSEGTLVFDTETTVDAAQRLRIGAYQFRKGDEMDEGGLFYDPAIISDEELSLLRRVAAERGLELRSVPEFIDEVLFARAYDLRASVVGFNLPFDISRLAINHGSARGKAMRGGFTFKLSRLWWRPAIQLRHLNARASLIQFTHPPKRRDPRGQRKRKIAPRNRRGSFIDLKTIAAAPCSRSFSLASLADFLKTPTRKAESGGHGKHLTADYVRYLLDDVQATWECYKSLRDKYALHALEETPLGKVLSEASLGKA
jgi:hypothetical protein